MDWKARIENISELDGVHTVIPRFTGGYAIGIIAVNLIYPKIPGNVANASTYDFPVLYREVEFEIERLFTGDLEIEKQIIDAARWLEAQGVRAIVGACGYFAHFQKSVSETVSVPVLMSSLCQLPLIKTATAPSKRILVLAASGDDLDDDLLSQIGSDSSRLLVHNIGSLPEFAPIRWGGTTLDNGALKSALVAEISRVLSENDDIGAILLECSDLPPYAKAIQASSGLPVFDFNTMINMLYNAVSQKTYFGML